MKYVLLSCILGMLVLSGCGEPKPRKLESCKNTPTPWELRGYKELHKYMLTRVMRNNEVTDYFVTNTARKLGIKPEDLKIEFRFKDIKTKGEEDGVFTCTATLEYDLKQTAIPAVSEPIEYTLHRVGNGIGFTLTKPDIKAYNERYN